MLEKINAPSIRPAASADLYDWDELVQEDRVHRLIYTDPAIFQAEMTTSSARSGSISATKARSPSRTTTSPRGSACGRSSCCAIPTARSARCSTAAPIAAPRSAARSRAMRSCSSARITAGASSIPASCARCRGRTAMPAISRTRSSTSRRCRASTAIAASSSARSISMRRRCSTISAASPSRSTNGSIANPGGKVAVCEANRLKYKGNWKLAYDNSGDGYHVVFSHRSLLEMENRLADEANKGMSYYKGSPDSKAMYMAYMGNGHHFKDKRPEHREARRRTMGGRRTGARHRALRRRDAPALRRQGRGHPRSRLLRAGQHQRVPELLAARQPHPGVRAGVGR